MNGTDMLNKIYETEILDADGETLTVKFKGNLDCAHPVFSGHFPSKPILPGVCMVDIVRDIARRVIDDRLVLAEASNIKFTAVVDPVADSVISADFSYGDLFEPGDICQVRDAESSQQSRRGLAAYQHGSEINTNLIN